MFENIHIASGSTHAQLLEGKVIFNCTVPGQITIEFQRGTVSPTGVFNSKGFDHVIVPPYLDEDETIVNPLVNEILTQGTDIPKLEVFLQKAMGLI